MAGVMAIKSGMHLILLKAIQLKYSGSSEGKKEGRLVLLLSRTTVNTWSKAASACMSAVGTVAGFGVLAGVFVMVDVHNTERNKGEFLFCDG